MTSAPRPAAMDGIHHTISPCDLHAHLFEVALHIDRPAKQQMLALPVWIPGSYLVREFAKHVQDFSVQQNGQACAFEQLDKATWRIHNQADAPLTVRYRVYAHDASVRTAWLDSQRGFFNGTSVFFRVLGQEELAHSVCLLHSAATQALQWRAATGLPLHPEAEPAPDGFATYRARNYDELVDGPFELGPFWEGQFEVCGISHRFVVAGAAPSFDGARLLADTQRICHEQLRFWHGSDEATCQAAPHKQGYVFMLWACADAYGGLEHRNSTALICKRADLPRLDKSEKPEDYHTLLGLISHEYFHTWNVKQLRPAEFAKYNYQTENHTQLLWFFEGFTSYYDDLFLLRAGLINLDQYLALLAKHIQQVQSCPGRFVQSVAQASFDAWTRYYRPDENSPNSTISYYTKGALVALCLDLRLRQRSPASLDDVMRQLWRAHPEGPISEADVLAAIEAVSGLRLDVDLQAWVHGVEELPFAQLLQSQGIDVLREPASPAQTLGLRVQEGLQGLRITHVLSGSVAQKAGFAAGDECLVLELPANADSPAQMWRFQQLSDLRLYGAIDQTVRVWVARDKQVLRLQLEPAQISTVWGLRKSPAAQQKPG
jgi:predicted metalloprotease with PDZ domain